MSNGVWRLIDVELTLLILTLDRRVDNWESSAECGERLTDLSRHKAFSKQLVIVEESARTHRVIHGCFK